VYFWHNDFLHPPSLGYGRDKRPLRDHRGSSVFGAITFFSANLERAQHRSFKSSSKYERAAIARRQSQQLAFSFRRPELRTAAHNPE
jgi:hypothetical protein